MHRHIHVQIHVLFLVLIKYKAKASTELAYLHINTGGKGNSLLSWFGTVPSAAAGPPQTDSGDFTTCIWCV